VQSNRDGEKNSGLPWLVVFVDMGGITLHHAQSQIHVVHVDDGDTTNNHARMRPGVRIAKTQATMREAVRTSELKCQCKAKVRLRKIHSRYPFFNFQRILPSSHFT